MEFTMTPGGVPTGSYSAEFIGAEPFNENIERFGPGVLLKWRIVGGEYDGAETSRICSARLTPKSALGKLASQIKGGPIATGEKFSFDKYSGVRGTLIVEYTEAGSTRVASFTRQQVAESQPAASQTHELSPEQLARAAEILQHQQENKEVF